MLIKYYPISLFAKLILKLSKLASYVAAKTMYLSIMLMLQTQRNSYVFLSSLIAYWSITQAASAGYTHKKIQNKIAVSLNILWF